MSQLFRIFVLVILVAGVTGIIPVVHADELYPTITDVYFSSGGQPYNETVQFTVNCYGYLCKSWDCQRDPSDLAARNGGYTPELVFSYHATCPLYGCRIYEPYYHAERNLGARCTLEGVTQARTFTIRNFSRSVIPENCSNLQQFSWSSGRNRYYNETPEYRHCINETRRLSAARCDQYLEPCEPGKDYDCGYWSVDGNYVKETASYRACADTIARDKGECNQYVTKVNMSDMILWKSEYYDEQPAMRSCELRFEIPPETDSASLSPAPDTITYPGKSGGTVTNFGTRAVAIAEYHNPIATLYCSMVSLLGGKCE